MNNWAQAQSQQMFEMAVLDSIRGIPYEGKGETFPMEKIVPHLFTAACFVCLPEMPRTGHSDK